MRLGGSSASERNSAGSNQSLTWSSWSALPTMITGTSTSSTIPVGIDAAGEIVGNVSGFPLVWAPGASTPTRLATGPWFSTVQGITTDGVIYGTGKPASGPSLSNVPIVWPTASADPVALVPPAGWSVIGASMPTRSGVVVGIAKDATGDVRAIEWATPGTDQTAVLLPATSEGYDAATGASPTGQVYGSDGVQPGVDLGVVWTSPTEAPTVLALPSGFTSDSISGMSSNGVIIGTGNKTQHQYLLAWASPTSTATVLDTSGYDHVRVTAIGDSGTIFGTGDVGGKTSGIEWTTPSAAPSPAPALQEPCAPSSIIGVTDDGGAVGEACGQLFVWTSADAVPTPLDLGTFTSVDLLGVTATGTIVGHGVAPDATRQVLVWPSSRTRLTSSRQPLTPTTMSPA